jgi:hypothetical protein
MDKLMTCFLEYETPETVRVTDLVYTRGEAGWSLNKSSYVKLRLSVEWVAQALSDAGFTNVTTGMAGRLDLIVARTS